MITIFLFINVIVHLKITSLDKRISQKHIISFSLYSPILDCIAFNVKKYNFI